MDAEGTSEQQVEPDLESVRLATDFGRGLFAHAVAAMRS